MDRVTELAARLQAEMEEATVGWLGKAPDPLRSIVAVGEAAQARQPDARIVVSWFVSDPDGLHISYLLPAA